MKLFAITALIASLNAHLLVRDSANLSELTSDPIHGSAGPPKINRADLTPAQQFEFDQRHMKPQEVVLDEDVKWTKKSIEVAEDSVGSDLVKPGEIEKFDEAHEKAKEAAEKYKKEVQGEGWQGVHS